eukprot:scaffold87472_cov18-Phaeocystis_antarctica.AAC.1
MSMANSPAAAQRSDARFLNENAELSTFFTGELMAEIRCCRCAGSTIGAAAAGAAAAGASESE